MRNYLPAAEDVSDGAVSHVHWLLEQWGIWARCGVLIRPTTPMARYATSPSEAIAPALVIDDDTAMAIDREMCRCEKVYPKGYTALNLYYQSRWNNRNIAKRMGISENSVRSHKDKAVAYLVGRLTN